MRTDKYFLIRDLSWMINKYLSTFHFVDKGLLDQQIEGLEDEFVNELTAAIGHSFTGQVQPIHLSDYVQAQLRNISGSDHKIVSMDSLLDHMFPDSIHICRQFDIFHNFPKSFIYTAKHGKPPLEIQARDITDRFHVVSIVEDDATTGGTLCYVIKLIRDMGGNVDSVNLFTSTHDAETRLRAMNINIKSLNPDVLYADNVRDLLIAGKFIGTINSDPIFVPNNQLLFRRLPYSLNEERIKELCLKTTRRIQETLAMFGVCFDMHVHAECNGFYAYRLCFSKL